MDLLGADYYSLESARAYWSVSQVKRFRDCEARALAELEGVWSETGDQSALLVGNFVHSYFESPAVHETFIKDHYDQLFSSRGASKGQLKSDFRVAERMIRALKKDQQFQEFYQGQKEVAISGTIAGLAFKGKIDCLNLERGYFIDLKTTRGPIDAQVWVEDPETGRNIRQYWFEAYGYLLQMGVYRELLRQTYGRDLVPILYAVTKEEPSDTCPIWFGDGHGLEVMAEELAELEQVLPDLEAVKSGQRPPKACQRCAYCREKGLTRKLWRY